MYGSAAQGDATRRLDLPDPLSQQQQPTYREQPILDDPYHPPYPNSPYEQPAYQQPPNPTRPYPVGEPADPYAAQPYSAQPYAQQPGQALQPYSGQPYSGQPYSAQPALHPYTPAPAAMVVMVPVATDPLTGAVLSDKSKIVAGLLQLLPGFIFGLGGIGRLYAGHTALGVVQLLVSFVGWGLFWCGWLTVLAVIGIIPLMMYGAIWLWWVIDGIVLLAGRPKDGQGRQLRS
jgi:TM2 domain-containing membrane protein YozV